jgi:hypothetical protein
MTYKGMEQQENKYKGKFVIAFDTICEGNQTSKDENEQPVLYDSYDEAFKELFDDAHSMLSNRTEEELEEYNEGVTPEMVEEMGRILESGDVRAMEKFLNDHPECNDNGDWVEPADEFIEGRKTIFTGDGVQITGNKLS